MSIELTPTVLRVCGGNTTAAAASAAVVAAAALRSNADLTNQNKEFQHNGHSAVRKKTEPAYTLKGVQLFTCIPRRVYLAFPVRPCGLVVSRSVFRWRAINKNMLR